MTTKRPTGTIGKERELPPPDEPIVRATADLDARQPERRPARTDDWAGGGVAPGSSDLVDDEAAGGGPSGDGDEGEGPGFEEDRD